MTPADWKGPYLEGPQVPKDPWGNHFFFRFEKREDSKLIDIVIKSYGPDGKEGGGDDIEYVD